jgi:hypothetical protein
MSSDCNTAIGFRPSRTISLARVMLWVACVAVILAGVRRNQFFPALLAVTAYFVLAMDLLCVAIQFITGKRAIFVYFPRANWRVRTREPLWAIADGCPIRIELTVPIDGDLRQVDYGRVANRIIDGKTVLCDVSEGTAKPLDLMDRGPLLVYHERHGLCLVQPTISA